MSTLPEDPALAPSSTETPATTTGTDSGAPANTQPPVTTLFSKSITSVTIEIDYAPGAEPYVGTVKDFGDPWSLFNTNVLAFEYYKQFFVDSNLGPASAVVTILLILIAPLMWLQIRTVRHQESLR